MNNHPILTLAKQMYSNPDIKKGLLKTFGSEEYAIKGALIRAAHKYNRSSRISKLFTKTGGVVDTLCKEQGDRMIDLWRGKSHYLKTASPLMYDQEIDPKTFEGRQQPKVMDLLRQYEIRKKAEKIPGGLADGKSEKDFNKTQLSRGMKVELEHTTNKTIAKEIAMDHLIEDKDYYMKLKSMEKKAVVGWGGQHAILGTRPVGLNVGYNYLLGVVPWPSIGLRLGTKGNEKENIPAVGLTLGTDVGISVGVPKKVAPFIYTMQPSPRSIYKFVKDKLKKEAQGNEGFRTQDYDDSATVIDQVPDEIYSRENYRKYLNRGKNQLKKQAGTTTQKVIKGIQKELRDPKFYTKTVLPIGATVVLTKALSGNKD